MKPDVSVFSTTFSIKSKIIWRDVLTKTENNFLGFSSTLQGAGSALQTELVLYLCRSALAWKSISLKATQSPRQNEQQDYSLSEKPHAAAVHRLAEQTCFPQNQQEKSSFNKADASTDPQSDGGYAVCCSLQTTERLDFLYWNRIKHFWLHFLT